MKIFKIITIASILIFGVKNANSQVIGYEGKRFSAETSVGVSMLFNKFLTEGSELGKKKIYPSFRSNTVINYTIARKTSLGLMFSTSKNKFEGYNFSMKNAVYLGIGAKISIFTKDFISPIGSNYGFYIKYNSLSDKNHVFEKPGGIGYELDSTSFNMSYMTMGLSWNKMMFLSSKHPIYLKYGINASYSFKVKYKIGDETYSNDELERLNRNSGHNVRYYKFIRNYNTFFELFEYNIGIGYVFGR